MREPLLTWGLSSDGLKRITEVPNGQNCGCICPKCKLPLIAKNGGECVTHHFSHHTKINCTGAYESALHLLAKEVFKEIKKLRIPNYHYDYDSSNKASLYKPGFIVEFENIDLEKTVKDDNGILVKPDAVAYKNNAPLFIEFAHTNFVGENKKDKLRKMNLPVIEVDLTYVECERGDLSDLLLEDTVDKYWVHCPKLDLEFESSTMKRNIEIEKERIKNEREKKLLEQQEIEKKLKESVEANRKAWHDNEVSFFKHKSEGKAIHIANNGIVRNCQQVRDKIKSLASSQFYEHEVLKYIIDGIEWDGLIRGNDDFGHCVILEGDRFPCKPSKKQAGLLSTEENKYFELFYSGLLEIKSIQEKFGNCNACKYLVEKLRFDNDLLGTEEDDLFLLERPDLSVCGFPTQ